MQIWKDIPNYEGLYQVSSYGLVRSNYQSEGYSNWKILKPQMDPDCYLTVNLTKDGESKRYKINRLVLLTFCPIANAEEMTSSHLNEIRWDNRLENLEWATFKDNQNYGERNARIGKSVYCVTTNNWYPSSSEAARKTGLNNSSIGQVCKGQLNTTGGTVWKYMTYDEAIQIGAVINK